MHLFSMHLQRLAMREASPVYKSLTPEEKAIYIKKAEGVQTALINCIMELISAIAHMTCKHSYATMIGGLEPYNN